MFDEVSGLKFKKKTCQIERSRLKQVIWRTRNTVDTLINEAMFRVLAVYKEQISLFTLMIFSFFFLKVL